MMPIIIARVMWNCRLETFFGFCERKGLVAFFYYSENDSKFLLEKVLVLASSWGCLKSRKITLGFFLNGEHVFHKYGVGVTLSIVSLLCI